VDKSLIRKARGFDWEIYSIFGEGRHGMSGGDDGGGAWGV